MKKQYIILMLLMLNSGLTVFASETEVPAKIMAETKSTELETIATESENTEAAEAPEETASTETSTSESETMRSETEEADSTEIITEAETIAAKETEAETMMSETKDTNKEEENGEKHKKENKKKNKEEPFAYSYASETLQINCKQIIKDGSEYFLTNIVISNPKTQIKVGQSYGDFGGTRELPSDAAKRLHAKLLINGSYFLYETGKPNCEDILIQDGKVVHSIGTNASLGNLIAIKEDGTIFSPEKGTTADQLIADGVVDSLSTGDPILIKDGELMSDLSGGVPGVYPRTGIGMVGPGNYYIVTAGTNNYKNGCSYKYMQSIFADCGCTFARTLDGGGSATLVIDGDLINSPACGKERAVVDFLYFTD